MFLASIIAESDSPSRDGARSVRHPMHFPFRVLGKPAFSRDRSTTYNPVSEVFLNLQIWWGSRGEGKYEPAQPSIP